MAPWRVVAPGPGGGLYAVSGAGWSGGVLPEGDDDVVAEGFELALGVAGLATAGGGVVQQVPHDDEDGPAHGAAGLLPPAAAGTGGQAAEALAQEGIGVRGGVGG